MLTCTNSKYCPTKETFQTVGEFLKMCAGSFKEKPALTHQPLNKRWVDETGETVLTGTEDRMPNDCYEIRVHIEDITQYIGKDTKLYKMCGGKVWNVWAFMPRFGQVYCSTQPLTISLYCGSVAQSSIEYPDEVSELPDHAREKWAEELDELLREIAPDSELEAFDREDAMLHSYDFTLDYKGERWADYEDLEEAYEAHEKAYDDKGRSDSLAERQAMHAEVEKILEKVRDHFNSNDLASAVTTYLELKET